MIALGVVIKMLTHFPAEFCFPWSETKFSSGETQHAGEPPAQTPARWAHVSTAVRHTCHKHFKSQLEFAGCSCQDWSEGSRNTELRGNRVSIFRLASSPWDLASFGQTWPYHSITNGTRHQQTPCPLLLTKLPTQVHYVNTESAPLEWLLPTTIGLLQNIHLRCLKDEWVHNW